jgi:hypothetical protein
MAATKKNLDWRAAFSELTVWQRPGEFRRRVTAFVNQCRSREFFNDPKLKFLHDAWTLAELIKHKRVSNIRLARADERWPDGYVQLRSGRVVNVEVTIALMPGRKMGEEYKFDTGMEFDPVEDWIARADAIPEALETAIKKKIAKQYGSSSWLVVYLNRSEYGIRQHETVRVIVALKHRYADAFERLLVLWKDKLY